MHKMEDIVATFLADAHPEGKVIPHKYFWDLFGLDKPLPHTPNAKAEREKLHFTTCMDRLKSALLDHKLDLQNVYSQGRRLVPYLERVSCAAEDNDKIIKKALRNRRKRMLAIEHPEQLPLPQQRVRELVLITDDTIMKMVNSRKRYPT